jgi:hypothetical protein
MTDLPRPNLEGALHRLGLPVRRGSAQRIYPQYLERQGDPVRLSKVKRLCLFTVICSTVLIMTACTSPAATAHSTQSASSLVAASTTTSAPRAVADARCLLTVTVSGGHGPRTQYVVGGVIDVTVGQRLMMGSVRNCAPSLQTTARPNGVLMPVTGSPDAFLAATTGVVELSLVHAMCDGLQDPGCLGGIAVGSQVVQVHPSVA